MRHFGQHFQAQFEPLGTSVPAAIEARHPQRAAPLAQLAQEQQRPFVMMLKRARRDHRYRQHFGVADVRQFVRAVSAFRAQFIQNDKDRYNPFRVQRLLLKLWFVSPAFSGIELMGAN